MKDRMFRNALAVAIILLFIGVAVQPAIAEVSTELNNSELEEVIIQFFEVDGIYEHSVMLTQNQLIELEYIISNLKNQLISTDNPVEVEMIYYNAIVSLNDLGLLPNDMSIDYAQRLVTGKEQNLRVIKLFERMYSKNQDNLGDNDNILCLIAGDTVYTVFIGPFALLSCLLGASLFLRRFVFLEWFRLNYPEFFKDLWENFDNLYTILLYFRIYFWLVFGAALNYLPLKIGAYINYGWLKMVGPNEFVDIPAEGWISTTGLCGKKEISGKFSGRVIGFTGIKIIREFLDYYYLGAALKVNIET